MKTPHLGLTEISLAAIVLLAVSLDRAMDANAAEAPLFAADEPLTIELEFDSRALCRPRPDKPCADTPATLSYVTPDGSSSLNVRLRARGAWRSRKANCSIPPLFVYFDAQVDAGGPFEGQRALPLTTHCRNRSARYEQYVLKEYLAYRLYNLFTRQSLAVRLASITYRDARSRRRAEQRYGFFTEHFAASAARQGAEVLPTDEFDYGAADPREIARLELFQYLIGNTDWSVIKGHNVTYTRSRTGAPTAVPYDFDFSGIVDAAYAEPAPGLPIRSVGDRLYRGFCHPGLDWDGLFETFLNEREAVDALVAEVPGLAPKERLRTQEFARDFFDVVASPATRTEEIVAQCRQQ
jgi:hypothetical protein